jgi:hypothetical protein
MMRARYSGFVFRMWFALALVVAAGSVTWVVAQGPPASGHHEFAAQAGAGTSRGMMGNQAEMMSRMAAADKKLDELVAAMNAATGDAKVAAIAAVVTELAAQRGQMQQMMQAQGGMMMRMMAHMSAMHGGTAEAQQTPPPASADPSTEDHSSHHPTK